jgi:hypothetical protein
MTPEERLRARIKEIAQRRNNVTIDEIEWVMGQFEGTYQVRRREARHGVLFGVGDTRFMVNCHNPGSKQVKSYSVDEFIDAMVELGWHDEDDRTEGKK